MRVPRDLSGAELVKRLERLGYGVTRQTGSHLRLSCTAHGEHHLNNTKRDPLRTGTLAANLAAVANQHCISLDALLQKLFE